MYTNKKANVAIGTTQPIMGTKIEGKNELYAKIEGKNEAAIEKIPVKSHYNSR